MLLWTIQPIEIWNMIQETGVYRCDPEQCWAVEPEFQEKYNWLISIMKARIGVPPAGVTYPVWGWYMQNGKRTKPDLRRERWHYGWGNEEYVCIELEIPDDQVLLSDFDVWCIVLNNGLISKTEEEDKEIYAYYDTLDPAAQQAYKEKNWERVLDISPLNNHWTKRGSWVQATFWELRKDMIRNARFFVTAHSKIC